MDNVGEGGGDKSSTLAREWMRSADEVLADADLLLSQNRNPRSIVNRTYYGMFYAVRALLASRGIDEARPRTVAAKFAELYVDTGIFEESMANILLDAFEMRLENDYRLVVPSSYKLASSLLADARKFVLAAHTILKSGA
jgi:uncharacterized protein (UPF0332 family)